MSDVMHTTIAWSGDTQDPAYNRVSELAKPGGRTAVPASSSPKHGGDGACWNPEDLLSAALAECYMLTFLALATKTRLAVKDYRGTSEAALETVDRVTRVASITLRPTITVAPGTDHAKVLEMFAKAHKYCTIANSINSRVIAEATVVEA